MHLRENLEKIFQKIPPDFLPSLFKNCLEEEILCDIFAILSHEEFFSPEEIYEFLRNLIKVPRLKTILMFLESKEKKNLAKIFDEKMKNFRFQDEKIREFFLPFTK